VGLWIVEHHLNVAPPGQTVQNRPVLLPNPDGARPRLAVANM
jgi:hypothetical protein